MTRKTIEFVSGIDIPRLYSEPLREDSTVPVPIFANYEQDSAIIGYILPHPKPYQATSIDHTITVSGYTVSQVRTLLWMALQLQSHPQSEYNLLRASCQKLRLLINKLVVNYKINVKCKCTNSGSDKCKRCQFLDEINAGLHSLPSDNFPI